MLDLLLPPPLLLPGARRELTCSVRRSFSRSSSACSRNIASRCFKAISAIASSSCAWCSACFSRDSASASVSEEEDCDMIVKFAAFTTGHSHTNYKKRLLHTSTPTVDRARLVHHTYPLL